MKKVKELWISFVISAVVGLSVVTLAFGIAKFGFKPVAAPTEIKLVDAIPKVINNVVHIRNNTGQWQGSGVLIAPDLVLTARHVVEAGKDFEIKANNGQIYKAERAISSKKYDLGFIKLKNKLPCSTTVGDINDCQLGQTVYAIGSPYGDVNQNSITAGIVSSLSRKLEKFGCPESNGWSCTFQTDAAGHPGNSGCPVYTLDGKVRGILVGGFSNALIYCIPAALVTNDCQVVELMFLMDEYKKEEAEEWKTAYEELQSRINGLGIGMNILDERLCELEGQNNESRRKRP